MKKQIEVKALISEKKFEFELTMYMHGHISDLWEDGRKVFNCAKMALHSLLFYEYLPPQLEHGILGMSLCH